MKVKHLFKNLAQQRNTGGNGKSDVNCHRNGVTTAVVAQLQKPISTTNKGSSDDDDCYVVEHYKGNADDDEQTKPTTTNGDDDVSLYSLHNDEQLSNENKNINKQNDAAFDEFNQYYNNESKTSKVGSTQQHQPVLAPPTTSSPMTTPKVNNQNIKKAGSPSSQQQQQKETIESTAAFNDASDTNFFRSDQQQQTKKSMNKQQQQHFPPEFHVANSTPSSERTPQQSPADRSSQTRDLVKKFIADIWNRGELDLIPDVCSPSLRFNGNAGFDRVGHDGLARMVATIRDALDEYHCEIHSMVVEDNKAFCRLRFTGKHTGALLGFAPTRQSVAWLGATEFTCQNGRILKVWELGDVKSLEEQLTTAAAAAAVTNDDKNEGAI